MPRKVPNPIDVHVGSRVRLRRNMLEMSQGGLADGLDLTFQQVQKYEKGTNRIGSSRMLQIAQILRVPPSFFYEGAPTAIIAGARTALPQSPSPSIITDQLATKDGLAMVLAFAKITNKEMRRRLVDVVEQIAGD